jgi:hypothetical protein
MSVPIGSKLLKISVQKYDVRVTNTADIELTYRCTSGTEGEMSSMEKEKLCWLRGLGDLVLGFRQRQSVACGTDEMMNCIQRMFEIYTAVQNKGC